MLLNKSRLFTAVAIIGLTLAIPRFQFAQDVPELNEQQKSVFLFDIRVSQLMDEAKEIGIDLASATAGSLPLPGNVEIEASQIKRIFGSASFPENINSAMQIAQDGSGDLPFEFFVRIEFTDADIVEMVEKGFSNISETVEIGGKTYYQDRGPGPKNLVAHRVDETSFEIGTISYCQQSKRSFFSDRLKAAFQNAPNEPIRIVLDLETRADFLNEAVAMGKQMLNDPVSTAYLDLIDNSNSIVLSSGLSSSTNLLTLTADGKDKEQAEELASGLDGILGTAKMGAGFIFGQMENDMPKEAASGINMLKRMVSELAAKQKGNAVKIEIAKPEGFQKTMATFLSMAEAQSKVTTRKNNFRQLALAALNYESAYRAFPFQKTENVNQNISWRVKILPFIEQNFIHDQMDLKESPKSEANAVFADRMPVLFGNDGKMANATWIQSKVTGFASLLDGASNTVMLVENPAGRPWMENNPLTIDEAVALVSSLPDDTKLMAVRYDGSTLMLSNKNSKEELTSMFDPTDGK